jgi:hypothetical protein
MVNSYNIYVFWGEGKKNGTVRISQTSTQTQSPNQAHVWEFSLDLEYMRLSTS